MSEIALHFHREWMKLWPHPVEADLPDVFASVKSEGATQDKACSHTGRDEG